MRLIDADELKALRNLYIQGKLQFDGNEYDLIDKCPTIDVTPVRHGQWIERKSLHADGGVVAKCSICEKDVQYLGQRLKYCPNCGAKMSKEE